MKIFPNALPAARASFIFGLMALGAACSSAAEPIPPLLEARRGFETRLLRKESIGERPEQPPAGVFELVSYPSPLGRNAAYLSPPPADGKKRPAIIWLVGGFSNSIEQRDAFAELVRAVLTQRRWFEERKAVGLRLHPNDA